MAKYENDYFTVYEHYCEDNFKNASYYVYEYRFYDGTKHYCRRKFAMTLYDIIKKGYEWL